MKNLLSHENRMFRAWLATHRKEMKVRLTVTTPRELQRFARKIITDLAFDGNAVKFVSGFRENKRSYAKFRHTRKMLRQLKRAWIGIVRVREQVQSAGPQYHSVVTTFKLR